MKKSIENLRKKIKAWLVHQQRLRCRKLQVVRLEDRRLPDASFGLVAGVLTLEGFDGGDSLTLDGGLSDAVASFTLKTGVWDAADPDLLTGPFALSNFDKTLTLNDMSGNHGISVRATNALASVNTSTAGVQIGTLEIFGGGSVDLSDFDNDFDTVSFSAESLILFDVDSVELSDLSITLTASVSVGSGDITDEIGATIDIGGSAEFQAASIVLGDDTADITEFGSLSFAGTGDVEISEDDSMSVSSDSTAGGLTLISAADISLDARIEAAGDTSIIAGAISGHMDVNAELTVEGSIFMEAADDVTINSAVVATDLISISAGQDGTGAALLNVSGSLTADNVSGTADITIIGGLTAGNIVLNGTTTADDVVEITTAGSINGTGLINVAYLALSASEGIGANGLPLTFDADSLITQTDGSSQFLMEANEVTIDSSGLNAGVGRITLSGGTFTLDVSERINDSAKVNITGGATLRLGSHSETIDQLILTDGSVTGSGTGTLTATSAFDVRNGFISAALAGSVGLAKTTSGTVTLALKQATSSLLFGAKNRAAANRNERVVGVTLS